VRAAQCAHYMKHDISLFHGVRSPAIATLFREHIKPECAGNIELGASTASFLLQSPIYEAKYMASFAVAQVRRGAVCLAPVILLDTAQLLCRRRFCAPHAISR
jgi:hypothetical protein